jgi:putative nucleotidyltransferase with HDIG domain
VKIFAEYDPAKVKALGLSGLLRHSVRVGAYARIVASEGGLPSDAVDDAFAAGLLHDVGRLVLGTWLGAKSGIVAARIRDEALPFWEIERQVFNATHAQVGAYMMGLWGLPDELVEAVAFHHNPADSPNVATKLNPLGAVYLADAFSFENDDDWPGLEPTLSDAYLSSIGVSVEQVEQWRQACLSAISESDVIAEVSG